MRIISNRSGMVVFLFLLIKGGELLKKELWVTATIPKQATILLVDIQEKYFKEGVPSKEIEERLKHRLERMKSRLNDLKGRGHTIYAVIFKRDCG